jgi:hypothetical protein
MIESKGFWQYTFKIIQTFKSKVVSLSLRHGTPRLLDVEKVAGIMNKQSRVMDKGLLFSLVTG